MRKDYTILVPTMLPIHFTLMSAVFKRKGYKIVFLEDEGRNMGDVGIKYVHNDMCYPAIIVIGQLIDALQSGKYNTDQVALLIMQTGGGCRASNYLSLLRKALERSGFPHVPVVSLNVAGLERNPGFKISASMYGELAGSVVLGDLIMLLRNQCRIREIKKGETDAKTKEWLDSLTSIISKKKLPYAEFKKVIQEIVADFAGIERSMEPVIRVGIVGEIYVKYSPLGNNNLEKFLYKEGAEVVVPGLIDFCLYCVYNNVLDNKLYGMNKKSSFVWQWVTNYLEKRKNEMIATIKKDGHFQAPSTFKHITTLPQSSACVSIGMKMGEGWLLTAEMLELYEMGIKNIVCTQPFGCLPNHIVGKGMMRPIKELYHDVNIVAIDYDPGASKINQENRLKLMLANAKKS
ncbi:MAG: 2-hydroxyglutaryl-CoA dehydratase [Clostridia bacterium]|nr:2-hydroxyglutaryl-CoA dehydratase [Clostridia bacterium]